MSTGHCSTSQYICLLLSPGSINGITSHLGSHGQYSSGLSWFSEHWGLRPPTKRLLSMHSELRVSCRDSSSQCRGSICPVSSNHTRQVFFRTQFCQSSLSRQ